MKLIEPFCYVKIRKKERNIFRCRKTVVKLKGKKEEEEYFSFEILFSREV